MISVSIYRLPHSYNIPLPEYATKDAAGMDLRAAIPENETWILYPGERRLIPIGLIVAIPCGYEGQVRPRSGFALKHGITVLNSPGTIDSDYRGEIKIMLINHGTNTFELKRGERIAQLLLAKVPKCCWVEKQSIEAMGDTERGSSGYGSTGTS